MASSDSPSSSRPPRFRFTIGGMFVMMLGISVGLAHWRLPQASPASAILLACGAWLVIGLGAHLGKILTASRNGRESSSLETFAGTREIGWYLGLMTMLLVTAVFDLAARFRWSALEGSHPDYWEGTRLLTQALLYLAFICIYWTPAASSRWEQFFGVRLWRRILDVLAVAGGIYCVSVILRSDAILYGLVYVAIRGVENYQPWRWQGHEMYPANLATDALMAEFINRGFAAAGLFVVGTISGAFLLRIRGERGPWRIVCLVASATSLAGTLWLLMWCRNFAVPRLSPILPPLIGYQPPGNLFLVAILVFVAAALAACWLTADTRRATTSSSDFAPPMQRLLLDDPFVLLACVLALLAAYANEMWYAIRYDSSLTGLQPQLDWLYSPQILWAIICHVGEWMGIYEPVRLLRLAALLVMVRRTRAAWYGKLTAVPEPNVASISQLNAAWLFSVIVLLFAGPVGAWWSMALTFHYDFGF